MSYSLYRQLIDLTEDFEQEFDEGERSITNFSTWLSTKINYEKNKEKDWVGKENGRTAESIINTSLIHIYRYAKIYSKLAIADSPFSTIDDVIFLINLLYLGSMTKTQLVELNIHEKSTGIQIINRLLSNGFIAEVRNPTDKRSKFVMITPKGESALGQNMDKIRKASSKVVGNLNETEKMQLIRLLNKLELFHKKSFKKGLD